MLLSNSVVSALRWIDSCSHKNACKVNTNLKGNIRSTPLTINKSTYLLLYLYSYIK